ncbi:MAG TPA: ZIP family metal transporter [Bryobacteraceae bacterium]|nr:ZIP family metal transporter [Bryobacteraceae bacterium]
MAAALIAVAGAGAGIWLAGHRARRLIPLSGALLVAVTALGLVPEIVKQGGFTPILLIAAAYAALSWLDHHGLPVCPSCSHGEAFAPTLLVAVGIHAFVDGWGMSAVQAGRIVPMAIGGAILLHKIPEGLALGGLLESGSIPPWRALLFAIMAEAPTVLGGYIGLRATPGAWLNYALALAAGTFLFLGVHAITGWRARINLHS